MSDDIPGDIPLIKNTLGSVIPNLPPDVEAPSTVRKASDVLLSVEEKLIHLSKVMNTYDMNIKIILDRTNKIYSYIEELKSEYEAEKLQAPIPTNPNIIDIKGEENLPVAEALMPSKRALRADVVIDPVVQAPPTTSENKVSVIQRVCNEKGKDLFMADVSIIDQNKTVVQKTKTTTSGKWQARLKPGKYVVNIIKTDTETKNKIESMQEITVPDSAPTFTLPVIIIKR